VPGSIQSLVQERIDRLDPPDKAAVQAASVLGQCFVNSALAYLIDRAVTSPSTWSRGSWCGHSRRVETFSCSRMC
jgi:predicted ATPase